jgi:hypothetical protein
MKNMIPIRYFIITVLGLILTDFWIKDAYAYIDPSSATMFIQVIVGALVGVGITIKVFWYRIKDKFTK